MPDDAKYKGVKVQLAEGGNWFISPLEDFDVVALFDGAEVGEAYTIELLEMTKDEFDALPEFTGF